MERTVVTAVFIAFMSGIYYFGSPGGHGMPDDFWWFFIPALCAQGISTAVKIVEMSVGPTTWNKLEEHANKAMCVANIFESIAIREVGMMVLSDSFWARLFINWFCIGIIGVTCGVFILGVVKGVGK